MNRQMVVKEISTWKPETSTLMSNFCLLSFARLSKNPLRASHRGPTALEQYPHYTPLNS